MAKMINRVIAKMLIENEKERSARTKDENDFRCQWYLKVNNKYSQVQSKLIRITPQIYNATFELMDKAAAIDWEEANQRMYRYLCPGAIP